MINLTRSNPDRTVALQESIEAKEEMKQKLVPGPHSGVRCRNISFYKHARNLRMSLRADTIAKIDLKK
jgi:hypothetical protein